MAYIKLNKRDLFSDSNILKFTDEDGNKYRFDSSLALMIWSKNGEHQPFKRIKKVEINNKTVTYVFTTIDDELLRFKDIRNGWRESNNNESQEVILEPSATL